MHLDSLNIETPQDFSFSLPRVFLRHPCDTMKSSKVNNLSAACTLLQERKDNNSVLKKYQFYLTNVCTHAFMYVYACVCPLYWKGQI